MYQSGRAGDEAKKRKSPAKSGRVGITELGKIRRHHWKERLRISKLAKFENRICLKRAKL